MKLSKNVFLSCEILAAHKLRTLLSVLGIVVGVAAVVLMVSAGKGAEERILERIRDMGTNLIVVSAGQTRIIAGRQRQMSTVTTLVPDDAKAIVANCPSAELAAASTSKALSPKNQAAAATMDSRPTVRRPRFLELPRTARLYPRPAGRAIRSRQEPACYDAVSGGNEGRGAAAERPQRTERRREGACPGG